MYMYKVILINRYQTGSYDMHMYNVILSNRWLTQAGHTFLPDMILYRF